MHRSGGGQPNENLQSFAAAPVMPAVLPLKMLNRLITKFNDVMEHLVDAVRLRLIGPHLLGDIPQIPLPCKLDDALKAYGEPYEQSEGDVLPDTQNYTFEVHDLHLVQIWVWKSEVHQILYTSPRGDGATDLQTVFDAYGDGKEWTTWTEGYLYASADDSLRVWCSALPMIGVGTKEFVHFRDAHKSAAKEQDN
ncbi:hypothetical protein [Rosistilla oblonga]|uniref:Uncharacterized protein n=1 Tax=Rosistilla oblonga TaxID=2527990 RepID=A0A518J131_9BACT|nr:hypothetical protein [Rosistilla oblonga]QDV59049.1 hypothetical protein Mal33_50740 [Rosistilla oblonga]